MYSLVIYGRNLLLFKNEIIYGRKSTIELRKKWCNFRVSVKLLQNSSVPNSLSSASVAVDVSRLGDGRKGKSFTVSYLVGSLGLSTKHAESISRKVSFEDNGNPDSVLNLLRSYGFTESQISSIITGYPRLLVSDAEKSLGPNLKFLQSKGVSSSELTEIVSTVPKLLGRKAGKSISVYYDLVKEIIQVDKSSKFEKFCHSFPEGSKQKNIIRNIWVLRELGMPQQNLFSLLFSDFSTIYGKEKFEESLKKVVEIGINPTSSRFVDALNFVYQMSDKTLEEKVNIYKRLGFAEEDVWEIFKKFPAFLGYSEKKILNSVETFLRLGFSRDEVTVMVKRFPQGLSLSEELVKKKIEFVVKKIGWPLKAVVLHPPVLGYSMEKRIVPRCNVIKALFSKGLIGNELPPLTSVLTISDKGFLKRYVRKHDDDKELVGELMTIFTGKKN